VGFSALDVLPKVILRRLVGLVLLIITVLNYYLVAKEHQTVLPVASPPERDEKVEISSLLQAKMTSFFIGICIGFFTMVANLAGPLLVVYLLKCDLSKEHINGTRAWLFLILNMVKLPLQVYLGNLQARNIYTLLPYVLLGIGKMNSIERFNGSYLFLLGRLG
jgi:uncharacterized membrane protein YfcA